MDRKLKKHIRDYFDQLNEVHKQEFIDNFRFQETDSERRKHPDGFSLDRIPEHEQADHKYYKGYLNEFGISNLVLPYHLHPADTEIVGSSGQLLNELLVNFENGRSIDNSVCFKKAYEQSKHFFNVTREYQEAEFLYLCNDFKVSHPGQYSSKWHNKLFIGGGFHRLVAYGLFIRDFGFSPLSVYYCEA